METIRSLTRSKNRLLKNLEKVSDTEISEISDFIEFMIKRRHKKPYKKMTLAPKNDPVLRLIGIANVAPFSKTIDRELYAE
jgi:hypothetical protein